MLRMGKIFNNVLSNPNLYTHFNTTNLTPISKLISIKNFRKFNSANFDIFQKLKDSADNQATNSEMKRKPTDKVIRLVDEIMSLTLIEAADLCDLCQEKLSERTGQLNSELAPGRSPFPHPSAMFSASIPAYGGMPPPFMPAQQPNTQMPTHPGTSPNSTAETPSNTGAAAHTEEKKPTKTHTTIKLVGYEQSSKVAVVKEVRAITKLGLTESKQLVESFPKIIKKGVEMNEAEELKKKLESIGAKIELE